MRTIAAVREVCRAASPPRISIPPVVSGFAAHNRWKEEFVGKVAPCPRPLKKSWIADRPARRASFHMQLRTIGGDQQPRGWNTGRISGGAQFGSRDRCVIERF